MKKAHKKGFTLVELVIVIAVIAILSAVLIPTFGNVIQNANDSAAFSTASNAITKYTTTQASAGQSTELPDGIVIILKDAKKDNWSTNIDANKVEYVFKFESGALVQYADDNKTKFSTDLMNDCVKLANTYNNDGTGYAYNTSGKSPITFDATKATATYNGAYVLDANITTTALTGSVILLAKATGNPNT